MHQLSQSDSNAGTQAVFSWQSDLDPNAGSWDAGREVTIPMAANDYWQTYTVDLSAEANWLGHHITAIRLEPTDGVAANVELDQLWGPEVGTFSQPQTVIAPPALLLGINPDVALFLEQANTDAFGLDWNRIFQANADDEPHGYTGQERLDLDVLFYGARLYMPELGRFLQVDPKRQYPNSYSYVGNNPVRLVDPTGQESEARFAATSDSLFDDWYDYINPFRWLQAIFGGDTAGVYVVFENGVGEPGPIDNNLAPMGLIFGILTDTEASLENAIMIAEDHGRPLIFIENESRFQFDLLEAALLKLGFQNSSSKAVTEYFNNELVIIDDVINNYQGANLWLVHSEGGIIFSEGFGNVNNPRNFQGLEAFTFGSASWTFPSNGIVNYVHYISYWDVVPLFFGKTIISGGEKRYGHFGLHPFGMGYYEAYRRDEGINRRNP